MARDKYTLREIWGDPKELSDGELARSVEYLAGEVERYPRGWAVIARYEKAKAEQERRRRLEMEYEMFKHPPSDDDDD